MANYVVLELDTTPPDLEIIAPQYTSPNIATEIIIESNEELSNYQEIYFIDSRGDRSDYIFLYDTDRYVGIIQFNQVATGIGTLYVRLKDEVYNISAIYSKAIEVVDYNGIDATVADFCQIVHISSHVQEVSINDSSKLVQLSGSSQEVLIKDSSRVVQISSIK